MKLKFDLNKKPATTALVLQRGGGTDRHDITHAPAHFVSGAGKYVPNAAGRFWIDKKIPRGWLMVFPESHAHPIAEQENSQPATGPVTLVAALGFWAEDLQTLTGGFWEMVFGNANRNPNQKWWQDWKVVAPLVIGAIAIAALGVYYWLHRPVVPVYQPRVGAIQP